LPFSKNLLEALMSHNWPGNLRELENVVNRYLVLGDETSILDELMPSEAEGRFSGAVASEGNSSSNGNGGSGAGLKALVRNLKGEAESTAIAQVLEGVGWNRKAAANDLQISYKALLYKIKQYDLSPQDRA
jgi:two-component system, NtrC family, response regulator AtoC